MTILKFLKLCSSKRFSEIEIYIKKPTNYGILGLSKSSEDHYTNGVDNITPCHNNTLTKNKKISSCNR